MVKDEDKSNAVLLARELVEKGYHLLATTGTARALADHGIPCTVVNKVTEGRPHMIDHIKNGVIQLIINTTQGKQAIADSLTIRSSAVQQKVNYTTTLAGAKAIVRSMDCWHNKEVRPLNCLHTLRKEEMTESLVSMD